MAYGVYTYYKTVVAGKLQDEIIATISADDESQRITVAVRDINATPGVCVITFATELPTQPYNQKALLDTVVAAHTPISSDNYVQPVQFKEPQDVHFPNPQIVVQHKGTSNSRLWAFSHDWCHRCSWYQEATRVVGEVLGTGDGVQTAFAFAHPFVIRTDGHLIVDEHLLTPAPWQGGTTYLPQVYVDDVLKSEEEFCEPDTGDFTIDHRSGTITFREAPANGAVIRADYFYSPNTVGRSMFRLAPPMGKFYQPWDVFIQYTQNIQLTDVIEAGIFGPDPDNGYQFGLIRSSNTNWKGFWDIVSYVDNFSIEIPPTGGACRGTQVPTRIARIEYDEAVPLLGNYGMFLALWAKHDRELLDQAQGARCTVLVSGIITDA